MAVKGNPFKLSNLYRVKENSQDGGSVGVVYTGIVPRFKVNITQSARIKGVALYRGITEGDKVGCIAYLL